MPAMTTERKNLRIEATKKKLAAAKSRFEKATAVVKSGAADVAALEKELELIEAWPVSDAPAEAPAKSGEAVPSGDGDATPEPSGPAGETAAENGTDGPKARRSARA